MIKIKYKKSAIVAVIASIVIILGSYWLYKVYDRREIKVKQGTVVTHGVGIRILKYRKYRSWENLAVEGTCYLFGESDTEVKTVSDPIVFFKDNKGNVSQGFSRREYGIRQRTYTEKLPCLAPVSIPIKGISSVKYFVGIVESENKIVAFSVGWKGIIENDSVKPEQVIGKSAWVYFDDSQDK